MGFHLPYISRSLGVSRGMLCVVRTLSCAPVILATELGAPFIDSDRETLTCQVAQRDGHSAGVNVVHFFQGYMCHKLGWTVPDRRMLQIRAMASPASPSFFLTQPVSSPSSTCRFSAKWRIFFHFLSFSFLVYKGEVQTWSVFPKHHPSCTIRTVWATAITH